MQKEIWKKVVGYDMYEISDQGNVRKLLRGGGYKSIATNQAPKYLMFSSWVGSILRRLYCHREMMLAFNPPTDPKMTHVCFKNGNVLDLRLDNLYWSTQSQRMLRRYEEQGYARGEAHFSAKLNNDDVREIRRLWAAREMSQVKIARKYGMHPSTVHNIIAGRYWDHLK
jgi:hypothetical protein